jgi:hypothetical protein
VTRLVDAEVTDADIAAGYPMSVDEYHPVALAVARALGLPRTRPGARPGVYLRVGGDWFSIQAGSFYESHDLDAPDGWIQDYDSARPVGPFRFTFTTAWGETRV